MDTITQNDTKIIAGLMGFAGIFSLIGNAVQAGGPPQLGKNATGRLGTDGRIIIGFTIGTSLLVLIAHAGEAGYKFATGLAAVSAVSSMLVYGKSLAVWTTLGKTVGGAPGAQPTGTTSSTGSYSAPTPTNTYQQFPEMAGEAAIGTIV